MWSTAEVMNLLLVACAAALMSLTLSRLRLTQAPCSSEKTGYPLALGRRPLSRFIAPGLRITRRSTMFARECEAPRRK